MTSWSYYYFDLLDGVSDDEVDDALGDDDGGGGSCCYLLVAKLVLVVRGSNLNSKMENATMGLDFHVKGS